METHFFNIKLQEEVAKDTNGVKSPNLRFLSLLLFDRGSKPCTTILTHALNG